MTDREKLMDKTGMKFGRLHKGVPLDNGVAIPKRGRWIIHSSGRGEHATNWAECSECRVCGSPNWKVCPVCETKMEDT